MRGADIAQFLSDKPALPDDTQWCYHSHKGIALKTIQQMFNCGSHCYTISNCLKIWKPIMEGRTVGETN